MLASRFACKIVLCIMASVNYILKEVPSLLHITESLPCFVSTAYEPTPVPKSRQTSQDPPSSHLHTESANPVLPPQNAVPSSNDCASTLGK